MNLTIQLDESTIQKARVLAAKRGTSVSAMVARQIAGLALEDERYEAAQRRALEILDAVTPLGGRTWSRDELYDRWQR